VKILVDVYIGLVVVIVILIQITAFMVFMKCIMIIMILVVIYFLLMELGIVMVHVPEISGLQQQALAVKIKTGVFILTVTVLVLLQ
jgi:hypothetical protein